MGKEGDFFPGLFPAILVQLTATMEKTVGVNITHWNRRTGPMENWPYMNIQRSHSGNMMRNIEKIQQRLVLKKK